MNAQQMQELCRELVGALRELIGQVDQGHMAHNFAISPSTQSAVDAAQAAITKAEQAFNPTPSAQGCVETAATVSTRVETGETVKALGVGPCCPVCGEKKRILGAGCFDCLGEYDGENCLEAPTIVITRAKQLAEAEAVLTAIEENGGFGMGGAECGEKAADYFRNKKKEPTA